MRYILSVILFCAIGAPVASALPTMNASGLSASDNVVQVAKKSGGGAKSAKAKSKKQDNGIHPLVGSGEY